jgi:hypothetical protein
MQLQEGILDGKMTVILIREGTIAGPLFLGIFNDTLLVDKAVGLGVPDTSRYSPYNQGQPSPRSQVLTSLKPSPGSQVLGYFALTIFQVFTAHVQSHEICLCSKHI